MYQLGQAYTATGNAPSAIKALQLAASTDGQLGQAAYMLLGQNYLSMNDYTNALMAFDAAYRAKLDTTLNKLDEWYGGDSIYHKSITFFRIL